MKAQCKNENRNKRRYTIKKRIKRFLKQPRNLLIIGYFLCVIVAYITTFLTKQYELTLLFCGLGLLLGLIIGGWNK